MKSIVIAFKESFVISVIVGIFGAFTVAYRNSRLKNAAANIVICFKDSKTYNVLHRYANKRPYYRYSIIYKIVMFIAAFFDKLFGIIHNGVKNWLSGSKAAESTVKAVKTSADLKLYGFGILFMSIPIGSIISLIILRGVSSQNMAMCWGIFIFGLLLVIFACNSEAHKSSLVIKVIKKFFDLIR